MSTRLPNRRAFLASVGAVTAAGLSAPGLAARSPFGQTSRGLAAADDFGLAQGLVYLQTGSLGPSPRSVMAAAMSAWQELERNPVFYGYGEHEHRLEAVRAKAAACLHCATDELVLTGSTTEGMNWVAQGLTFAPGDHVLTTDQEHPGGRACWDYVVRRHGVVLDVVPLPPSEHDPRAIVERFAERVTPRTKAFSFSHVLSSTGLRLPVAELSALARARGCLSIVDGAQAAGGIEVDVKALGCHAYATSGHKWLLGPKGTGLLFLASEIGRTIDPIALEGGRAAYSNSSGVCSLPSVLALGTALDYLAALGAGRIEAHNLELRNRLFDRLKDVPRLRVVTAGPGPLASPMLAYELPPAVAARDLHLRLRERHQVEVKIVPGQWFNGHRTSTHLFNTVADVDALVSALRTELGGG